MDKYEKIAKKINVSKETQINVPVYSEDTFIKLGKTEEDFYQIPSVEDIAYEYFSKLENTSLNSVAFKVIDENYLKWLSENKKEDSNINRQKYIDTMPDELNDKLWNKYEYNYGYEWGMLPLILENSAFLVENSKGSKHNFILSDKTRDILKKSAYESFRDYNEDGIHFNIEENNIYISPYVLSVRIFLDKFLIRQMFDEACREMSGQRVKYDLDKSVQSMPSRIPLDFFGIFVLYRYKVPSVITKDYIEEARYQTINRPDINVDIFEEAIAKDIDITFEMLTTNVIYPEEVDDAIQEFISIIQQQIDNTIESIDAMNALTDGHCKKPKKNKKNN